MRLVSVVVGIIAILVGGVFTLQGAGVLPGSVMTGQRMWLLIGIVVLVIGLLIVFSGLRRQVRT